MQKLLLVDSGTSNATRLKNYLTRIGYQISAIAHSAEQAVENTRLFNPDFIVMDYNIRQKQTGYQLYDSIRKYNQDIPILYMAPPAA